VIRRRNRKLIARALLALALFVAQSAAQAHANSHRVTDLAGSPTPQLCDECLSSAPLLNAAGGGQQLFLFPRATAQRAVAAHCITAPAPPPFGAFQARAPPASSLD
jgi:hypothetical protein